MQTTSMFTMQQPGLLDLPAELRNHIYELILTPNHDTSEDNGIDIRNTAPPSHAIVLVCKKTYHDALLLCLKARETYWTNEQFVLDLRTTGPVPYSTTDLDRLILPDLQRIRHLKVIAEAPSLRFPGRRDTRVMDLYDSRGIWRFTSEDAILMEYLVFCDDGGAAEFSGDFVCWTVDAVQARDTYARRGGKYGVHRQVMLLVHYLRYWMRQFEETEMSFE